MNWDKKATTAAVKNRHDLYEEDEDGYEDTPNPYRENQ